MDIDKSGLLDNENYKRFAALGNGWIVDTQQLRVHKTQRGVFEYATI